jgi:branched-chain amino acid transport system ATP-binding protein
MKRLFQITNLSKNFGGLSALMDLSFEVSSGQIIGVIGPNGAGKTTLFNCLSRLEEINQGRIVFNGRNITHLAPHQVVRLGLARTFQTTRFFMSLTVLENVMVGRYLHSPSNLFYDLFKLPPSRSSERASREAALAFLDLVKLADLAGLRADQLTLSQARRLELARALAGEPKLLLLDEPGAGMDEGERSALTELLKDLYQRRGLTLMIIEHDIGFVVNLCTELLVLNFGRLIARGRPAAVQKDQAVLDAYLGESGAF